MSTVLPEAPPTDWTIADVQARLPGFPANRIRVYPTPGTATGSAVSEACHQLRTPWHVTERQDGEQHCARE